MKYATIAMMCVGLLSACDNTPKRPPGVPEATATVKIDMRLLNRCPPAPELVSGTDTDIQDHMAKLLSVYSGCKTDKDTLNNFVRDTFNLQPK